MKRYLSALGCLAFLLGGSPEIHAREFTVRDPSERPNIAMDCHATRYVNSQPQQSSPFDLHLAVNFADRYAVVSPEFGRDKISMALTGIATLPEQEDEYIVLTNGPTSAIVSMQYKYIIVVKSTVIGLEEYNINGQGCKTTFTN